MEEESDDQLMIRLQSGEPAAFDVLVRRYQGQLLGYFIRNTFDVQFAEDLTQETLLKVYNQAWDYFPSGRFRAWMFRIGRNLLVDNIRRRTNDALIRAVRRSRSDEQDDLARVAAEFNSAEEQLIQGETAALVDELVGQLPAEQRETFTLHVYAELGLPEIAEITGVNLATCKSRLRLAREKLVEKLRIRGVDGPTPQALGGD